MDQHQIPPPPYSVTDLYSNSDSFPGSQPYPALTTGASNLDDTSVPGRYFSDHDTASSTSEPAIYTPPYTPDGDRSSYRDSIADGLDNIPSPTSAIASSASAYFESRPVLRFCADSLLVHHITITSHTRPSDLPFPQPEEKWLESDVLPQDWETFVNYLIPSHADISNHSVADRKLEAELINERMHGLTLDQNDTSRTDLRNAEAQLEPLRRSHTEGDMSPDINAVVVAWNEGFFGPRGIFIDVSEIQPEDDTRAMPGSWINDPTEAATNNQSQTPPCRPRRGFGGSWIRVDNNGFHIGRNMISADNSGFRIGKSGLVADSNGFRIGNLLVADGQGFKLGPIRADANGFRIGGGNPPIPAPHGHNRVHHPWQHRAHMSPVHRGRPSEREFSSKLSQRDRSHSTSSSSSSSASSIESTGSLPDCDHLKDTQLPVAKQAIRDLLNNSDQFITKQTVKQISQEIKGARCGKSCMNESERDALRKEVRDLVKEFKEVKKYQKRAWKAARRNRKSLRREAKRTRKTARREIRHAEKEVKHAEKEVKKAVKKEVKAGKMRETISSMPAFPTSPEVPGAHTPPGAWASGHEYQSVPHPPLYMSSFPPTHSIPHAGPSINERGWSPIENSPAANVARAAAIQAEGRRIEAEAIREEAFQRAEESRQQAEAKASIAREKAQVTAALARERAEEHRHRAEANASIARQKAEANHMLADANKMLADVNRMRMQAAQLKDKARLKLLDAAEKLEEDAEKAKREGEKLMAEALESAKDLAYAFNQKESAE